MKTQKSKLLIEKANQYIPGGVNSPVRAFKAVGGHPPFIKSAKGCQVTDVDGNSYIDYVCSWGPLILGHAQEEVVKAVQQAATKGTSYGAPIEAEIELARIICESYSSIDKVRLVNSGTEATMSALRLARGFTGRDYIVKFEGCYHGHADFLLAKAGSGVTTFGLPESPGVPADAVKYTITCPYNDLEAVEKVFQEHKGQIAAVILEPVAGNMGVIPPVEGFLEGLRDLCTNNKTILIFDEVMTGFRVSFSGAQGYYNIEPDLTCLGKVIGGGLPVGAYGGRGDIMAQIAPEGPVYQAGTLSGNPLAVAAGLATLKALQEPGVYDQLEERSEQLSEGIAILGGKYGLPFYQSRVGSMACLFFNENEVRNFQDAKQSDAELYAKYFRKCLEKGIYFAPSQFEAAFVSLAHTSDDIAETLAVIDDVFEELSSE